MPLALQCSRDDLMQSKKALRPRALRIANCVYNLQVQEVGTSCIPLRTPSPPGQAATTIMPLDPVVCVGASCSGPNAVALGSLSQCPHHQ